MIGVLIGAVLQLAGLALTLAPPLSAGAVLLVVLVREEKAGRSATGLLLVLGLTALDCLLFPSFGTTGGVFRPTLMGHGLSLQELVTPVALLARVLAGRPLLRRTRGVVLLWALFWALLVVAGVDGALAGNDSGQLTFEAFVLLHVAAVSLLAAGTSVTDLVSDRQLPRLGRLLAVPTAVLLVTAAFGVSRRVSTPLASLPDVGGMGADAATVLASVGLLGAAVELSRPAPRGRRLTAPLLLCLAPAVSDQRAALLALGVGVLVAGIGLLRAGGRRVVRMPAAELLLPGLAVVAALAVVVVATELSTGHLPGSAIADELGSTAKAQSAQSRLNQWGAAWHLVQQRPWLGHGLGTQYVHFEVGFGEFWTQDITHNVLLDLALRMGAVGVTSFLLATAVLLAAGWRSLRRTPPRVAALQATVLGALVGLLARGMVESVLEKHRLAVLLGVLVGLVYALTRPEPDDDAVPAPPLSASSSSSPVLRPGAVARSAGHVARSWEMM